MAGISIADDRHAATLHERATTLYETEEWIGVEDWLTVLSGFVMVVLALYLYFVQYPIAMPAFRWATDVEFAGTVESSRPALEKLIQTAGIRGETSVLAAAQALQAAMATGDRAGIGIAAKKLGDATRAARDAAIVRAGADLARKKLASDASALVGNVFSTTNLGRAAQVGLVYLVVCALAVALIGGHVGKYLLGFPIVFALAWLAQIVAGNATVNYWGIEYVVFALLLGLLVSNLFGVPPWLMEAVKTEYYVRAGLIILGATILFQEILTAGAKGIIQAVLVVTVIWYVCFWLCRRLKVDDGFAAMLATAVSICGVSAAIAAYGAVRGDRKKLSYVTSLVLMVAVPMMILQPWIARLVGMPDLVAGAWLGGTLDTSASVVAAGELISLQAMKIGTIVKLSQNVLIGVVAFLLAFWWVFRQGERTGERPRPALIWERFPKFVLGFLVASAVFSFLLEPEVVDATKPTLSGLRTFWFAMAFVCVGLETRFTDLVRLEGGRPALAFLGAQAVNIVWALLVAYVLFSGRFFAVPAIG
jgi:uncharacterized integral membrane protein (TIGR00698 family)